MPTPDSWYPNLVSGTLGRSEKHTWYARPLFWLFVLQPSGGSRGIQLISTSMQALSHLQAAGLLCTTRSCSIAMETLTYDHKEASKKNSSVRALTASSLPKPETIILVLSVYAGRCRLHGTADKLSSATRRDLVPNTTQHAANQVPAYEQSGAIPLIRSLASLQPC